MYGYIADMPILRKGCCLKVDHVSSKYIFTIIHIFTQRYFWFYEVDSKQDHQSDGREPTPSICGRFL